MFFHYLFVFSFYQNQFINEYARKKKAEISESRSHRVTESRGFLVRYRRTYVLKNISQKKMILCDLE